MRRRVNLKGRNLVREAMNLDSGQGIVRFVHRIFLTTLAFELTGAALSFLSFVQDYEPLDALASACSTRWPPSTTRASTFWATSRI